MTYLEFRNKYNGIGIDFDGYYGFQCMDLWQQYNKEVFKGPHVPAAYAYMVWAKDLYPKNLYTKIANTPTGVPQQGDVIVWKPEVNGGAGHIAVFDNGNVNSFQSFDQNWNGAKAHLQNHNYNYVYGWLRPKAQGTPQDKQIAEIRAILDSSADSNTKIGRIKSVLGV